MPARFMEDLLNNKGILQEIMSALIFTFLLAIIQGNITDFKALNKTPSPNLKTEEEFSYLMFCLSLSSSISK